MIAPQALLSPILSLASDRYEREGLLSWAYLALALLFALVAFGVASDVHRLWIYVGAVGVGVAATPIRPSLLALLPRFAEGPRELAAGNAAVGVVEDLGALIGPLGAAALLWGSSVEWAIGIAALLCGAATAMGWRGPRRSTAAAGASPAPRWREAFVQGLAFLRDEREPAALVTRVSLGALLLGAVEVLTIGVALRVSESESGDAVAGVLAACFAGGGLVGSVFAFGLAGRRALAPAFLLGACVSAAPLLALALHDGLVWAAVGFCVSGAGHSFAAVAGLTLVQRAVPDRVRGRMFGISEALGAVTFAVGAIGASVVSTLFGLDAALVAIALAILGAFAGSSATILAAEDSAVVPDAACVAELRADPIFAPLSTLVIEALATRSHREPVEVGTPVTHQGEAGTAYFRVLAGALDVEIDGAPTRALAPGDGFGEIALLQETPRTATIRATAPTRLLRVERSDFLEAVTGHRESRRRAEAKAQRLLAEAS